MRRRLRNGGLTMNMYRCVLTKSGKPQAVVRMPADRISFSGLSRHDEDKVLTLRLGDRYEDADGDRWERVA
jgi:hypothetical protein